MAKKESKAKQRVNEFTEQLDNVFLAGLGAFANAQKMGSETFESLVKDGEKFRKEASKKTEKLIDEVQDSVREMRGDAEEKAEGLLDRVRDRSKLTKLQSAFDRRVADAMDRLNVPSKNDIDKINRKLDKILKAIEPKAKKPATRKKAAAKKAPARKAAAKKAPATKRAAASETKAA
jgi:poly(hydroxyalkanoate) granule-associated protein